MLKPFGTPHPLSAGELFPPFLLDYVTALRIWFGVLVMCLADAIGLVMRQVCARFMLRTAPMIALAVLAWMPVVIRAARHGSDAIDWRAADPRNARIRYYDCRVATGCARGGALERDRRALGHSCGSRVVRKPARRQSSSPPNPRQHFPGGGAAYLRGHKLGSACSISSSRVAT